MDDFVNSLELSVRATGVLKRIGIADINSFMALRKEKVMATPNAGIRTWREIAQLQQAFSPPTPEEVLEQFRSVIATYNRYMFKLQEDHGSIAENTLVRVDNDGYLHLYIKDGSYE